MTTHIYIKLNDTKHNGIQHNDTQHNGIQHNVSTHIDIKHNDTQMNGIQHNDTQINGIQHNDSQHNNKNVTLKIMTLNAECHNRADMVIVIMLSVVAPKIKCLGSPSVGVNHRGALKTNILKLSSVRLIYFGKVHCKTAFETTQSSQGTHNGVITLGTATQIRLNLFVLLQKSMAILC